MQRKRLSKVVSIVVTLTLASSLFALPASAYASSSISNDVDESTSWTSPTYYIDNTVYVDVDGDGETELAKVITTWANAWALSGPDYIGVSNSGTLSQSGGNASSDNYLNEQTSTMLGIWASTVNEVPNAYNWNYFYNLYLAYTDADDEIDEEQVTSKNVQNGADAAFDSQSGVWGCFKYRPEIIWCSNSLSASACYTYTELIRNLTYYTDSDVSTGTIYEEVEGLTEFVSGTTYYTYDGTSSFTAVVFEADSRTTYYILNDDGEYEAADTSNGFEDGVTYYTATTSSSQGGGPGGGSSSGTTTYTEVTISTFDADTTYYVATGTGYVGSDGFAAETGDVDTYYVDGDESYDPYVLDPSTGTVTASSASASATNGQPSSAYTLLDSLYVMVDYVEAVEEDTADYNSDGAVTEDNVTWKTMNSLPRTTRYEASSENAVSAREAALDVEKAMRGSVWYTLAKIADGTIDQKTVAFVSSISSTGTTATVVEFTAVEGQRGAVAGKVGAAGLTVNCLTTDTSVSTSSDYNTYTATAAELASADVIWAANSSMSVSDIETWLTDNGATVGDDLQIITDTPAIMNGHNFTFEKAICQLYTLNFIYPELFPGLELMCYWYDNVYHVTYDSLATCLTYGLGSCTLPSDVTSLSDLPDSDYSNDDIDAKVLEGYEYYASTLASDDTFSSYTELAASDTMGLWAVESLVSSGSVSSENVSDLVSSLIDSGASTEEITSVIESLVESLQDEIDSATAETEETQTALEEAQTALDEATAELESTTADLEETAAALAEAEAALEAAQTEATTLYSENVKLSKTSYTYTGKAQKPSVTVTYKGETLSSDNYTVTYSNSSSKKVGSYTVTVEGTGDYSGTVTKTYKITKASQTLTVTKAAKTVKYSKVKKSAQTVKAITKVSGAKGTVTYTKTSGSKKITVNAKTGKIKVKKGTAKGTYKIKVKVKSAATTNYKAATKTVTVTVKVK